MITLEEAVAIVLENTGLLPAEVVPLVAAHGRVLAENVSAPHPVPRFDYSAMDGYAVRAEDISVAGRSNPVILQVSGNLPAGSEEQLAVLPGAAVRIMTGAPVPLGADLVLRREEVEEGVDHIKVNRAAPPGLNICRRGEDMVCGESVIPAGEVVTPAETSVLAALGYKEVKVYRRPRVAVISTGDELVDVGQPLRPGKIYNSNLYALGAAVTAEGGEPVLIGSVPDQVEPTVEAVRNGLGRADLMVTTGGVSVGDRDLVKEAYEGLGATTLFWRIAIKPGMPVVCARFDGKLLLGLSGNPAAALINFEHLVRPVILKMQGRPTWERQRVQAVIDEACDPGGGRRRFLRAVARLEEGTWHVRLSGLQGSGILRSLLRCNALIDVPAHSKPFQPGDRVDVLLLKGPQEML